MDKETISFVSRLLADPPAAGVWVNDTGIITGLGRSRYHWHPNYVCPHILASGHGTVRTPAGEACLGPGDMFCLWPDVDIEYGKDPHDPWRVYWFHLRGPLAVPFAAECGFGPACVRLRPARPDEVIRGFAQVFELFRQGETVQPYRVLAALYGIIDACRKPEAGDDPPRDRRQGLVARAEALAASGRPGGLNVSEMAAALQVSRTTLFTVFRDVLGITPIEFLTRKRLERAKDLMRRTRRPLRVIARMSGFGEPKYFLRRFKQCEGMTPTEWQRRNAGRGDSPRGA